MRGKRKAFAALMLLVGCQRPGFRITGATSSTTETEYAVNLTYVHTILSIGDPGGTYDAVIEVKRLSGGDPEESASMPNPYYTTVPVVNGKGEIHISGGYRRKRSAISPGDTWEFARYEVTVIAFKKYTVLH